MPNINADNGVYSRYYTASDKVVIKLGVPWLPSMMARQINTAVSISYTDQTSLQNQYAISTKPATHISSGERYVNGTLEVQALESTELLATVVGMMAAAGFTSDQMPTSLTDLQGLRITIEFYGSDPAVPMQGMKQIEGVIFNQETVTVNAGATSTTAQIQFQAREVLTF